MVMHSVPTHWVGLQNIHHVVVLKRVWMKTRWKKHKDTDDTKPKETRIQTSQRKYHEREKKVSKTSETQTVMVDMVILRRGFE